MRFFTMNSIKKILLASLVACSVSLLFTACKQEESTPVGSNTGTVNTATENKPTELPTIPQQPEVEEKNLTINDYSLGIYPYYKDIMTTYHCKKINKDMVVNGESVIVKDILKLTVGFTNSGTLPLAYLWSERPVIELDVVGANDISGYPTEIGSSYNVMYLMPGESITYDYFLKPTDDQRVIFRGESRVAFMPIAEARIINNPDYDLNEIFMPVLGAKNYLNYMVHSSQQFQIDGSDCSIKFIEKEPAEVSLDRMRHDYYTVDSKVMDLIRSNGYAFNNVTPVYGLRYSLENIDGAQDFIDDIDANISIGNNLQHSKNEYFAMQDGKTVLYVPDINRLTQIASDGGDFYDLNLNNPEMIAALTQTRLDLEDTWAKFVYTEGYISFILLSDGNYEYIKPIKDYSEFGMLQNKLYTPEQIAENITENADKLNSLADDKISPSVYEDLFSIATDVLKEYKEEDADKKNYETAPEGISYPEEIEKEDLSMDVNWQSGRSVVSLQLQSGDEPYTMLIIIGNSFDSPETEAVTFIRGERVGSSTLPIYDEENLLESINTIVERYKDDPPESKYYDTLPREMKFRKISSLEECEVVIDDNDITRATVIVPINSKHTAFAQIRVRDITGACRVVGVKFVTE